MECVQTHHFCFSLQNVFRSLLKQTQLDQLIPKKYYKFRLHEMGAMAFFIESRNFNIMMLRGFHKQAQTERVILYMC